MSNFIFVLGKTTGFEKNWGCVKRVGSSDYDRHSLKILMQDGEMMFDVDGAKFTLEQATEIATEKAEEIYGKSDIDFEALADKRTREATGTPTH